MTKEEMERQDYQKWLYENREKSKELAALAKEKGYNSGDWIISDAFPNTKLRIGYGMIWSEMQNALVVGCVDGQNGYYTAVPIYKPKDNWWATKVE